MMKINTYTASLYICIGLLAGCATPRTFYVPPSAGKTSPLKLTSTMTSGAVIVSTFQDSFNCRGEQVMASSRSAGTPSIASNTRIPTDRRFSLWFRHSGGGKSCQLLVSFEPTEGNSYEAVFSSDNAYCKVSIADTSGPFPVKESSLTKLEWTPRFEGGRLCRVSQSSSEENGGIRSGQEKGAGETTLDDLKDLMPKK